MSDILAYTMYMGFWMLENGLFLHVPSNHIPCNWAYMLYDHISSIEYYEHLV